MPSPCCAALAASSVALTWSRVCGWLACVCPPPLQGFHDEYELEDMVLGPAGTWRS